jgi:hypothetical protein
VPTSSAAGAPACGIGSAAPRPHTPLAEQVTVLRRELALRGTIIEVIDQAGTQLGVAAEGKSLPERATLCLAKLGMR